MTELDTMMDPPIEDLLAKAGSKFSLVSLASKRARQINSYFVELKSDDGAGRAVPPQVTSTARKPLSIAFEEIDQDKVIGVGGATGRPIPEDLEAAATAESDDEALTEDS
ncbi:MAG: DNA-directed RNA polymerase subunit omega [Microthrixaceae bacterium]|nr:DNA-directed RNA polymerase subunit omega [Microthrixaceae bacterium]